MGKLRNFDTMWDAYPSPRGTAAAAKATIGGAVDAAWIRNTCVVRISRCFNAAGHTIPRTSRDEIFTVRGGDGLEYALRVHEFTKYLRRRYGEPAATFTYPEGKGGPVPPSFMGKQGVVVFDVDVWSDATGHVDLWDGADCRHAAYFDVSSKVMLWEVADGEREPVLSASVGVRGRNRVGDVQLIQSLLAGHGFDPGPIDGLIGRKTLSAIRAFQRRFMRRPDGRIDPGGRSYRELLGL